ncbi:MAG: hypothetical protein IJM18_06050, partial [Clostridia bacterium]|nr:hypothetical protein [Clostridia bacterium]
TTGLKNGDVVTVSIDEYTIDEYIRSCGKAPMEKTKQYTVEGLDEYYKNVNEISDEALERLLAEAMDVAKANLSSNYDPATVYNLEAMELYVLSEKTSEGGRKTHNKIVVCFDQNGTYKFTDWGGTAYTGTFRLYYGICFDNVSFDKDGKLVESSLRDYKADNNWVTLKANSDDGKGRTSDYRALGYATVNEFIAKLVDPYRADYSVTSKVLENSNE